MHCLRISVSVGLNASDDFYVKNKERKGRSSKFEHQQLQALLDEDACQSSKQFL